ncbi:MAG: hypothetical protein WAU47_12665 [Desulfobaccales bacterium]
MCEAWLKAHKKYTWEVDLSRFRGSQNYEGYFNQTIQSPDVLEFENKFRIALNNNEYVVAGEVCYWKNYGNHQARNRVAISLLTYLKDFENWNGFIQAIERVSNNPTFENFITLQKACNQQRGFATLITFIAFYKPSEYPMVDKHIANWWRLNKDRFNYANSQEFSQRNDGWIQPITITQKRQNWNAYLAWKEFCTDYARRLARNCKFDWRARDVEMAVWEAFKNKISLSIIPSVS